MIGFPPCTHICASGARWWRNKRNEQAEAIAFFRALLLAPVDRIALENPVGKIGGATQIIQPWMFGHGEVKTTCLWLKNLPPLVPTNIVQGRDQKCWKMSPSRDRAKLRSLTYSGVASAMASQWSNLQRDFLL